MEKMTSLQIKNRGVGKYFIVFDASGESYPAKIVGFTKQTDGTSLIQISPLFGFYKDEILTTIWDTDAKDICVYDTEKEIMDEYEKSKESQVSSGVAWDVLSAFVGGIFALLLIWWIKSCA